MAELILNGTSLGNALSRIMKCRDIEPGDPVSYQDCKDIYSYHPLGQKLADFPIAMAQSQERDITVPKGPEDRLKEAYKEEWKKIGADRHIFNCARIARIYGVASIAMLIDGKSSEADVDYPSLFKEKIAFNVLDPLNTSGSLILDQNPNSMEFLKVQGISVQGQKYNRSRTVTIMNEDPIYIEFTSSSFGYVGRSVYQRALFQLKSYINTLITDDLIVTKAGVLIAKIKQVASAISALAAGILGIKRDIVREAHTGNVISVGVDEDVIAIDMKNTDGPYGMARKNILENIASAASTPAKIILAETFAEGFGEGTEDAKHVAQYIDRIRIWMDDLYTFFDKIVRYRAWNEKFYETLQQDFSEYGGVPYTQAFYDWYNSFAATWPSLLEEPDSEKVGVDDVKLKAMIAIIEVLMPVADPDNKASIVQWLCDNINNMKFLFSSPLLLDFEALAAYEPPQAQMEQEQDAPPPFSAKDSVKEFSDAVVRLSHAKKS